MEKEIYKFSKFKDFVVMDKEISNFFKHSIV